MNLEYLISKRRSFKGLLIDTNLLLLLLIGLYDSAEIGKVKRTEKYCVEDFKKLNNLLDLFKTDILITTNILSEICNLSENFNNRTGELFFKFIEKNIGAWTEYPRKSTDIITKDQSVFYKFGMTDASISQLAEQKALIITDDLKLYHYLTSKEYYAINYANLMVL